MAPQPGFGPLGLACDWGSPWAPPAGPPRVPLGSLLEQSEECEAKLLDCPWLFPPDSQSGGLARERAGAQPTDAAAAGGAEPPSASPPSAPEPISYEFTLLKSNEAKDVVSILLRSVSRSREPGVSVAKQFGKALKDFAREAHEVLTSMRNGQPLLPDEDRQKNGGCTLVLEAENLMQALVGGGALQVARDCILCLEAFGVSLKRPPKEQDWLSRCIKCTFQAALKAAPEADQQAWREASVARIQHEASELYSSVDVRAWPIILELTGADHLCIDAESFKMQLRLQLCSFTRRDQLHQGLEQAAALIKELRQAEKFNAPEIREIFNDHAVFESGARKALLREVLRSAPRQLVQEVLRQIDGDDVDISERDDEELYMVRDLIKILHEDIRCCKHTYFKMKSEWLSARWSGVVNHEELSPDQICDHIENEDNHEEFLKIAVNRCLRTNRKFEAARMLARPLSKSTKVYDTNRNDKQLQYLISLFQDLDKPADNFGPVEEQALVLPCRHEETILVEDAGENLTRLENLFFEGNEPTTAGIWWFWRCFDPKLDFWPRASFIALTCRKGDTLALAIVDFLKLESRGVHSERTGKDLVTRILQAPHILKVVHDLDRHSLQVLQRALVPQEVLVADESPPYPPITPVVDVAVVAAYVRRTRPGETSASKLSGLTFDYLRLELCLGESLGNFEQRPLRLTQQHYALTLAWCPLMILRVLCAYGVVTQREVIAVALRVGISGTLDQWDEQLRRLHLSKDNAAHGSMQDGAMNALNSLPGAYAENVWEDPQWRAGLPEPDRTFQLEEAFRRDPYLAPLLLPPEAAAQAQAGLAQVVDRDRVRQELDMLCEAVQRARTGQS